MVFKRGDTHWNKGKTKETDLRIARSGEIQSKTKKKLFSKGKLIPWNKGQHEDASATSKVPATCTYCGEPITKLGRESKSLYTKDDNKYHKGCYQKTPGARKKNSTGVKKYYEDPCERKQLSERLYKYWADPNKRKEQSIRMSKICNQPTYLKNLHTGQKRFHDSLTPEQTLKRLKKSLFKACISPNKSEKQIGKIVEHEPFHFEFTGGIRNPEHAIAGYFVDWTWVEINAAMDYHGPGGHDPSVPWVSENQAELDNIRSQRIRDAGWNYCILTEEDRQDIDKLILKVTDFVEKCKRSNS